MHTAFQLIHSLGNNQDKQFRVMMKTQKNRKLTEIIQLIFEGYENQQTDGL